MQPIMCMLCIVYIGIDSPNLRSRNGGKTIFFPFDQIQEGTQDQNKGEHHTEKYDDFIHTCLKGPDENGCLFQVTSQFEDPEHPEQSERTDGQQESYLVKKQPEKGGKNRQQINDSEKADCVFEFGWNTIESKDVFERKQDRKEPFQTVKKTMIIFADRVHAVHHDHAHAGQNTDDQCDVKRFAGRGAGFEDDLV